MEQALGHKLQNISFVAVAAWLGKLMERRKNSNTKREHAMLLVAKSVCHKDADLSTETWAISFGTEWKHAGIVASPMQGFDANYAFLSGYLR